MISTSLNNIRTLVYCKNERETNNLDVIRWKRLRSNMEVRFSGLIILCWRHMALKDAFECFWPNWYRDSVITGASFAITDLWADEIGTRGCVTVTASIQTCTPWTGSGTPFWSISISLIQVTTATYSHKVTRYTYRYSITRTHNQ